MGFWIIGTDHLRDKTSDGVPSRGARSTIAPVPEGIAAGQEGYRVGMLSMQLHQDASRQR